MNERPKSVEINTTTAESIPEQSRQLSTDTPFWMVVDPTWGADDLEDVIFKSSLRDLEARFKHGLRSTVNPAVYMERAGAEQDGRLRLRRWNERRNLGVAEVTQLSHEQAHCSVHGCGHAAHVSLRIGGGGNVNETRLCRQHGSNVAFDLASQFNELDDLIAQAHYLTD